MEADSTNSKYNKYEHSPESADTLSDPDSHTLCYICRARDTEFNIESQRLAAEENKNHIFFAESKIFLLCQGCYEICHLHCYINGDITVELLIDIIERNYFMCRNCLNSQE